MSTLVFTDESVAALPPADNKPQAYYWDEVAPGFGCVVSAKGRKVFVVRYRSGAALKKATIGPSSVWSVEDARKKAAEIAETGKTSSPCKGSGSITLLPSGSFRVQFFGENGRRESRTFGTEAEADEFIQSRAKNLAAVEGDPIAVRVVAIYPNDAERIVAEQPFAEPGDFQDITADLDGQRWGLLLHRGHLVNDVEVSAAQANALGGCSCRSESIPCVLHDGGIF